MVKDTGTKKISSLFNGVHYVVRFQILEHNESWWRMKWKNISDVIFNEFYLKTKAACFWNVVEYILYALTMGKFQNIISNISHVVPLHDTVNAVEANERSRSLKFTVFFLIF